ncbi:helix-turn-helix domain-containing protein [Acinetobacter pittii]|uniref:Helix-turn-helix domain-containing protein n=1 Tax=Acinetobacter pittii TaxID=48296 RepID=A0AAE9M9X0_ACIPI|nr:S24 family peptidase [Acinetobacter pittii]AZP28404.1 alkaline phosphatase [Acinetobacter pittii]USU95537.1 helix-turn-helix domain-containing protein [Acinetobacter pittii]
METLGIRLKNLRKQKKLTQQALADLVGVSKTSVIYWEKDENVPKHDSLTALAKVLGSSTEYLLKGKEPKNLTNFNIQDFINKHGLTTKEEASFDADSIIEPDVVEFDEVNGYIWIDVVEANFSCGTGESIEFHFDVINEKYPFPPSFFQRKMVDPKCLRLIKAKGDSMADYIHDQDLVGIDLSQTEIIDGEIYAVYFAGEGMIKQIFKEADGSLVLHSFNEKYRDRIITEHNGLNFKVMGRQVWRAG